MVVSIMNANKESEKEMAGILKPNIVELGIEGKVEFGKYVLHSNSAYVANLNDLVNEELTTTFFNNAFLMDIWGGTDYFTFTIPQKCNVWAISSKYKDSGGQTNQPVNLYKLKTDGYVLLGTYQTAIDGYDVWYKLFADLEPGEYKVEAANRYSAWQEWYVEEIPVEPPDYKPLTLLRVTMIDSSVRDYQLDKDTINKFIDWYNKHTVTDTISYALTKKVGIQSSTEYLTFDKIISFEVITI